MNEKLNINEKLQENLTDKEFLSEIFQTKDNKEIIKKFKSKGIDITEEDCEKIKEGSDKIFKELDKLDDNTLKELSGGWFRLPWQKTNTQKICDALGNSVTEVFNDKAFVSGVATGIFTGTAELCKGIVSLFKSKPQPAPQPLPKPTEKESSGSSLTANAASVVAVTAVAGLIYTNRKKIKKIWNNSTK